jgi:hypothetical protein
MPTNILGGNLLEDFTVDKIPFFMLKKMSKLSVHWWVLVSSDFKFLLNEYTGLLLRN